VNNPVQYFGDAWLPQMGLAWILLASASASAPALAAVADAATDVDQIVIIGTTPIPGIGIDIDKVPSHVQSLSAHDLSRDGQPALLPGAAARRMASVNLNNEQSSEFQPDFVFRGFEASPISGIAQGLAVYQSGVRMNEAFGDTVNWDLVPQFAVERLTVQSNNPVFGLNALGGAVTLDMKNGFNSYDSDLRLSSGSFGNLTGYAETAARGGNFGVYAAVGGLQDHGFRYHSRTLLRQAYVDLGYERAPGKVHLAFSAADNTIGAVGPTPVQMLQRDPQAVFTYPQSMHNTVGLIELSGSYQAGEHRQISANAYARRFRQRLIDGNTTDVARCANNATFYCLEGDYLYPNDLLYDTDGNPVAASALPAAATPGEIVHTATNTTGSGATVQWSSQQALRKRENALVIGVSLDRGSTGYNASGELGTLLPSLEVIGAGIIIDQGNSSTAQPPFLQPVRVQASNLYQGIYFTDTLNLTPALAWTWSGRYNRARVALRDLIGDSLNAHHTYMRFNPGAGVTYKVNVAVTAYASYSEANRTPTPAELSCSDSQSPCPLDSFLVSDPELLQVVSRTYEAGLRGRVTSASLPGRFTWNAGVFRTGNQNDIILLATRVNGFGYFSNAGATRRQGIEASVSYRSPKWELSASYSLVDATFRDPLLLTSNSPAANAQGEVVVRPGSVIPLTPRNRLTFLAECTLTARWKLSSEWRYVGGQFLVGDEANLEPQLPGYTVVNLNGSYQWSKRLRVFAAVNNVFARTYYTYGAFTRLDGLPPGISLTDPRTFGPSPGRTAYAGVNLNF